MSSSEWSGFTEEDLRRIRRECPPAKTDTEDESQPVIRTISLDNAIHSAGRKATFQSKTRRGGLRIACRAPENGKMEMPLIPQQSLAHAPPQTDHGGSVAILRVDPESRTFRVIGSEALSDDNDADECPQNDRSQGNGDPALELLSTDTGLEKQARRKTPCTCVSSEYQEDEPSFANSCSQDKAALERFEERRKQMEAENAKRKKVLLEALDDRKKRTREEAKKIAKIQTELGKLDSMLSYDVGILRNQIEMASLEFTSAEKRYEKAEKEFVEAKFALFQKMERKEQLTDYLCTIIEQNEIRKANKLSNLMEQLDLDSLLDSSQNIAAPSYPCILNGMTMNLCTAMASSQVGPVAVETSCDEGEDEEVEPPVVLV